MQTIMSVKQNPFMRPMSITRSIRPLWNAISVSYTHLVRIFFDQGISHGRINGQEHDFMLGSKVLDCCRRESGCYKSNPYSVPDLYDDMLKTFNKKKNAADRRNNS